MIDYQHLFLQIFKGVLSQLKNKPKIAIYARVSTDKQNVSMQIRELKQYAKKRQWKLFKEYIDSGYSGKTNKRPQFQKMLEDAQKRKFDVLLVWKLDRLSRSMKDLVSTLDRMGELGIDFVSYQNNMDTTTSTGKLIFHVLGAVAEFEREIISERIKAGLRNAKSKGKKLGRPSVQKFLLDKAKKMRQEGMTYQSIGQKLGVHYSTIIKRTSKSNS